MSSKTDLGFVKIGCENVFRKKKYSVELGERKRDQDNEYQNEKRILFGSSEKFR